MILNPWCSCISLLNDGITVGFQKSVLKTTSKRLCLCSPYSQWLRNAIWPPVYSHFSRHTHSLLPCNRWSHCKILHWHGKRFLYYPNHSDSQKNSSLDYFSTTDFHTYFFTECSNQKTIYDAFLIFLYFSPFYLFQHWHLPVN